jgi:transposase
LERRKFTREFKLEAVRLIKERGVSYAQASQDLCVHTSRLRDWVKKFADDPQHAFPGQGQMKPERLEIARLSGNMSKWVSDVRGDCPNRNAPQLCPDLPRYSSSQLCLMEGSVYFESGGW